VVIIFTWTPEEDRKLIRASGLSRDWSHEGTSLQVLLKDALVEFDQALQLHSSNKLCVLHGDSSAAELILSVCTAAEKASASRQLPAVFFNRHYEPWEVAREAEVAEMCHRGGIHLKGFDSYLFKEPTACGPHIFQAVARGQHIFKAFWTGWHLTGKVRQAVAAPTQGALPPSDLVAGLSAMASVESGWPFGDGGPGDRRAPGSESFQLAQNPVNDALLAAWRPLTEEGAWSRLETFLRDGGLLKYQGSITRDTGRQAKESKLSAYFRLGLLSMVDVYWQLDQGIPQAQKWLRRMAWRDYSYWMLYYWRDLPEAPMRPVYRTLPWSEGKEALQAWKYGKTGYPTVDAAMRELLTTGYMQQHMRHCVGQFLIEVLGISWVEGEEWFHVTLADADCAINSMMWQHQGLSGVSQWLTAVQCHPVTNAKNMDPDGSYVRRFVPELVALPDRYIRVPWTAPARVLQDAGVALGEHGNYPHRIVENMEEARACFHEQMRRCRACHPEWLTRGNDVIACPPSCPVPSLEKISALTERCMKSQSGAEWKGADGMVPSTGNAVVCASGVDEDGSGGAGGGRGKGKRRWGGKGKGQGRG